MEAGIPEDVRQFVEKHIRSLDQLEVLLLVSALNATNRVMAQCGLTTQDRPWSFDGEA
jgi:hypothetical protein